MHLRKAVILISKFLLESPFIKLYSNVVVQVHFYAYLRYLIHNFTLLLFSHNILCMKKYIDSNNRSDSPPFADWLGSPL